MWAAHVAGLKELGMSDFPSAVERRREPMREAEQSLEPDRIRAARERGAAMTLATAAEFAIVLTVMDPQAPPVLPGLGKLSSRERALITLVAQGRTNAQIAGHLDISVRTVRSLLDRIRDKTGYRRRVDLIRLALQAGLV